MGQQCFSSLKNQKKLLLNFYKILPSKHSLDQDVLRTFWRRLWSSSSKHVLKASSRRLDEEKYILINHTSSEDVFKRFSRRLGQHYYIRLFHTSSRRLQDVLPKLLQNVFKRSQRYVSKTTSGRFEDVSSS